MKTLREYIDLIEGVGTLSSGDMNLNSLVDFTDSDKYDNFTPPDDEEADDYKSGMKTRKKNPDNDSKWKFGGSSGDLATGSFGSD